MNDVAYRLLDGYDHGTNRAVGVGSAGKEAAVACLRVAEALKHCEGSPLFGLPKDASFEGAVMDAFQTFSGRELHPADAEKAAVVLYNVVKGHGFCDGNKRIGAAVFLAFLEAAGLKAPSPEAVAAMTLMVAMSPPDQREQVVAFVGAAVESVQ